MTNKQEVECPECGAKNQIIISDTTQGGIDECFWCHESIGFVVVDGKIRLIK